MDHRATRLAEERIGRLLWSFSLPAIAGTVAGSLYVIIDRAFLGNVVGADAIAALALCMPISFIIIAFGMLIGVGSAALISIRLGQQKHEQAELILGNALALTILVSIVLTSVFLVALDPLLRAFGASAATAPYARQFMRVILLGSFFQYASFGLNGVMRAEGNPRLAMMVLITNAGLNTALDALFIWKLHLGLTGAAVATVLSQAAAAGLTLAHFRSARSVLKLRLTNLQLRPDVVGPALAIGLAPFTLHVGASVIMLLINRGLARYGGDIAIGAYGVISAVSMLALMPIFGLVQGAQPIIGFNFGAERPDRVRQTLRLAILAATTVVCVGFVIAQVFPGPLLRAFARDPRLVATGTRGMHICLMMMPVLGFQVVGASFFQAIGKAKVALLLSLLRQGLVLIPMLLILPPHLGLDGVWAANPISDLTASLLTAAALVRELRGGSCAHRSA